MSDAGGDWCRWDGADLVLAVRVIPKAARTEVAGVRHNRLLIRVQAAPEDGKANAAVERLLARQCGVARGAVTVEAGGRTRDKRIRITRPGTLPPDILREAPA